MVLIETRIWSAKLAGWRKRQPASYNKTMRRWNSQIIFRFLSRLIRPVGFNFLFVLILGAGFLILKTPPVLAQDTGQARCGINLDLDNPAAKPDPAQLEGVGWARLVFKVNWGAGETVHSRFDFYDDYISQLNDLGVNVILVLNQETYWGDGNNNWNSGFFSSYAVDFAVQAGEIADHYQGKVQAYEIWNEPDASGDQAAPLGPGELNTLVEYANQTISEVDSAATVIAGGFLGDAPQIVQFMNGMSGGLDANGGVISSHPYTKGPEQLAPYLDTLLSSGASQVWLTEISSVATSYLSAPDDPEGAAEYVKDVYELLENYGSQVPAAVWFAWSDTQQDTSMGYFGLHDAAGTRKEPLFTTFYQYACRAKVPDEDSAAKADQNKPPLFILPRTEDLTQWRKYLANSQVYCAPTQVNWPKSTAQGNDSAPPLQDCTPSGNVDPLGGGAITDDGQCDALEYPVVEYQEVYNLNRASVPLWRNQTGGISIEADLSRVEPNDTFAEAAKRFAKPDYAPQFYLTSPQMQCHNIASYIEYVNDLCAQYQDGDSCPLQAPIDLGNGGEVSWEFISQVVTHERCEDYQYGSSIEKIIRALEPQTPKAYKIGFLVQHNLMFTPVDNLLSQYLVRTLAAWLTNDPNPTDPQQGLGERVTIVPVWYQSGISANEYSPDQVRPYPIDPEEPAPASADEVEAKIDNFSGPWWRTYSPALTLETQKKIYLEKDEIVRENYRLMNTLEGVTGPTNGLPVTFRGKESLTDLIIPCGNGNCVNQDFDYFEDLANSFPPTFSPSTVFLANLHKLILARVNSGVQETGFYPQGYPSDGFPWGPTSERRFSPCPIDQENVALGESETAQSAKYNLLQILQEQGAGGAVREAIDQITNLFTGKVVWNAAGDNWNQIHSSKSYLILPDESMDIDIGQAYLSSMFLSPEMYSSIMSGENQIFPFNEDAGEENSEQQQLLSAFLRTSGYDRQFFSEEEGYAQYEESVTQYRCLDSVLATCTSCSREVVVPATTVRTWWGPYPPSADEQGYPATPPFCVESTVKTISLSTVEVEGKQYGENPDSNIQVPGRTAALHEFLRRMAFTPHHLTQEYLGLEKFYSGQQSFLDMIELPFSAVGDYFRTLVEDIHHAYLPAPSRGTCDTPALFVNIAEAQEAAQLLRSLFSYPGFIDYLKNWPGVSENAILLNDCGGIPCYELILRTSTTLAMGEGRTYVNPFAIFAAVLTDNGLNRDQEIAWHFSCNIPAFSNYNLDATYNGLQCTVETDGGHTVINPVLIAMSSQEFYGNIDIYNTCVPSSAVKNSAGNREFSFADGLACFYTVMQSQYRQERSEYDSFRAYGYVDPGQLVYDRLAGDMVTIFKNFLRDSGNSGEGQAIADQVEEYATNWRAAFNQCR